MCSGLDRISEAATALLVTPSTLPWMIWQKWEVLDHYLDTEKRDGAFSDNRTVVALACIKADLMRFRIVDVSRPRFFGCPFPTVLAMVPVSG
jgi:hypothetical protein